MIRIFLTTVKPTLAESLRFLWHRSKTATVKAKRRRQVKDIVRSNNEEQVRCDICGRNAFCFAEL